MAVSDTGFASEAAARSSTHRWPGPTVLAIWLACVLWGFWSLQAKPLLTRMADASAPQRVQALEVWARELGAGKGLPVLFHRESACRCADAALDEAGVDPAAEAAQRRIPMRDLSVQSGAELQALLPEDAAWLLFGADGRLHYAGPASSADLCGSSRSLLLLGLARAASQAEPPRFPIIAAGCACGSA